MRNKSWEIILTGFIFIGLSVYLINHSSSEPTHSKSANKIPTADSIRVNILDNGARVLILNELSNLDKLDNLKKLEDLDNLKNLEKLKSLANFMPAEVKSDFIEEIDRAIEEIDDDLVDVQVDIEKGLISVEKFSDVKSGSWTAISPGVFAYVKEFDSKGIHDTEIQLPFGSITVVGTEHKDAKLVIQASGKISSKNELQSKIEAFSDIGETAKFHVKSISKDPSNDNIHLQATLNIPTGTNVSMKTSGGHIKATQIVGKQIYRTLGGHINLEDLNGEINAHTSGGHITLGSSSGQIKLITNGGHIKTANSDGEFILETSGGNIQAEQISGSLDASTNGGNIEIRLNSILGDANVKTGAGTITFLLPKSANADIEASGNSIELDSALNFSGNNTSGKVNGKIGNGGYLLSANTNYGKVIIKSE